MRCSTTKHIQKILKSGDVDIEGPVGLTRERLALMMNRSKLFVHAGYGGQNDRGILEAMCCGCTPLLFGQSHVSPTIWDRAIHITQEPHNIAQTIWTALENYNQHYDTGYRYANGLHEVALPSMRRLLSFIEHNPAVDRRAACNRFVGGNH